MPQVASDPTIHAHNLHLSRPARPAQPTDRPPSPFESLIDDGSQPVEQPAPAPTDNKAAAADGAQPAKANDSKTPVANDAASATKPDDEAPVSKPDNGKPESGTKVAADTKLAEGVTTDDNSKPASDDKPADGQKSDKPAVTTSPAIVQAANPADAIAVTPTPAPIATVVPDQGDQDGGSQQITLTAQTGLQLTSLDANLPKTLVGKKIDDGKPADTGQQAETDQPVGEIPGGAQPAAKDSQQAQSDKPQFTVSENDKAHVAEARGEPIVNGHHGNSDGQAPVTADSGSPAPKITVDTGTQPTVQTQTINAASNAAPPAVLVSQLGPQAAAIPLSGVAMEIAGKALEGKNRFEIRLDPPELGRIEVRLDVDRDGNVTSRMTVDRADTLDLLRRDATGLERALQDAGLKTADNSLQFSLRDQSMGQQQTSAGPDAAKMIVTDETPASVDVIAQNYSRLAGTGSGIDIRV